MEILRRTPAADPEAIGLAVEFMGLSFDECSKMGAATSRSYSVLNHWIWRGGPPRPMRSSILWFPHLLKDLRRLEPNLVVGVYVREADCAARVRHEYRRMREDVVVLA